MKKLILLVLVSMFFWPYANAENVGQRCYHAGVQYIDIPLGATCPDYAGGDAGLQSGWSHFHASNNVSSHHIDPIGEIINEGDQEHCLITKAYVEGPPRQIQ